MFRRRAGIEPVISHIKHDYRMAKNYLKGSIGDAINLFMAAAAFNFRKLIRAWAHFFVLFILMPLGWYWKPRRTALVT
jgi:transposase, IS5 family